MECDPEQNQKFCHLALLLHSFQSMTSRLWTSKPRFYYGEEPRNHLFLPRSLKLLATDLISLTLSLPLQKRSLLFTVIFQHKISSAHNDSQKQADSPEDLGNPIHTLNFPISVKEAIQALEQLFGIYGTRTHDRGF